MSVVNEKMQGIEHFLVVADKRHLKVLVNHFSKLDLGLVFFVDELDLPLFFPFFQQKLRVSQYLITLLLDFVDVLNFRKELDVVFLIILHPLFGEKLFAHVSFGV